MRCRRPTRRIGTGPLTPAGGPFNNRPARVGGGAHARAGSTCCEFGRGSRSAWLRKNTDRPAQDPHNYSARPSPSWARRTYHAAAERALMQEDKLLIPDAMRSLRWKPVGRRTETHPRYRKPVERQDAHDLLVIGQVDVAAGIALLVVHFARTLGAVQLTAHQGKLRQHGG